MDHEEHQRIIDDEHLKLLRIGYFVLAGTNVVGMLVGMLYMVIGLFFGTMMASIAENEDAEFAAIFPMIMGAIGLFVVVFVGGIVLLQLLAAKNLKSRSGRTLCLWAAGVSCLGIPWGTVVGISTFNVLGRNSVRALFDAPPSVSDPTIPRPIGM